MVLDPGHVARAYGVHSLPTTFVVDAGGVIRASFRGAVSETRLQAAVEAALAAGDERAALGPR
jgi:thioredoxin-like negative regulator of GroEL